MDSQGANSSAISSSSFDDFNSRIQAAALKATRNAVVLPSDIAFHRSMDHLFSRDLDAFSSRVLSLTNNLLALVATADASKSAKGKAKVESQDDVVDNFHSLVVDSVDQLLERTDICLDEFLGRTKPPAISITSVVPVPRKKTNVPRGQLDPVLQHASHLKKPQLSFKKRADNNNDTPWYPTLAHKYNAQVPLGYTYHDTETDVGVTSVPINMHPYRYEIKHISYPPRMFTSLAPIPPKSFSDTPFTWVATTADFHSMLDKLRKATEIAVDLEHHSYRTFAGFLCLMQISTREEDWIVDTLVLREELSELNEVFTDPKIVKVLHGAERDIVWLQQDFNLYIVNLFDTYHASKALDFPRHGLANLLEMYCDFTPDKRYQLADWRIRPLPEEMLQYARSDTHFLLFIYDNLRNALLDRALSRAQSRAQSPQSQSRPPSPPTLNVSHTLVNEVLSRSEDTALRLYEKELYDAEGGSGNHGWEALAKKWNRSGLLAGGLQKEVFKGIHGWRDRVAREDDESIGYVLSNHYLFQLAEKPPIDMAALVAVFHSVPPVIRKRAKELLDIIRDKVKADLVVPPPQPLDGETGRPAMDVPAVEEMVIGDKASPEASKLWSNGLRSGNAASSSSLFGSILASHTSPTLVPHSASTYSTSKSSLFGDIKRTMSSVSSARLDVDNPRFRDLVARIHSTLVIAPSAPKANPGVEALVNPEIIATPDVAVSATDAESATGMQIEMPYVPASQRKNMAVVEDSIVVVGQARQKKRKRTKTVTTIELSAEAEGSTPKKNKIQEALETDGQGKGTQEPFDYSAVPNILDDNPNTEDMKQRRKKKQKQNKGGVFEYGNFPAPPKAHSELKSGNQSHTFK